MNRIVYILLCLTSISLSIYSQNYYWYRGQKIPLKKGNQFYVLYEENFSNEKKTSGVWEESEIFYSNGEVLKCGVIDNNSISKVTNIRYQSPSYVCSDTTKNMFVTNRFYVKLKQLDDVRLLQEMVAQYNVEMEQNSDFPLWFTMQCNLDSTRNALELANIFYESGFFAAAEPEFINTIFPACVNDCYFGSQWNLNNTGQYTPSYEGIDINYCNAHALTSGSSSVIIGVFDFGVDLTHPDLNLYSLSYDAHTLSSPSQIYDPHGTACAGIISAKANNLIGVAGIAPNCPVMSISMNTSTTVSRLVQGINYAIDNGCSVINNSWSSEGQSQLLDDAIANAIENGRNGKGCVVVFAAGNENHNVSYPANSNSDILTVGAISPDGKRKIPYAFDNDPWGSNCGDALDVMAPGMYIYTTDVMGTSGYTNYDYATSFYGTSAACPHVSAIAGLILSVNPCLTQKEVVDIIESTSQKIGGYSYSPQVGRPNGKWNYEMGYGLVDAYAALMATKNKYVQNVTYGNGTTKDEYYPQIYAGYSVTNVVPYGNVVAAAGSQVSYHATESIHLMPGFKVENGASFTASIGDCLSNNQIANHMPERQTSTYLSETAKENKTNCGSIENFNTHNATKLLRDGQIFILRDDKTYTITGQRVE